MTSKFLRLFAASMFMFALGAFAQTGSEALPAAPSSANTSAPTIPQATGNKVGTINIDAAIYGSNEGQRDFEGLSKKLEPKQAELKKMNDDIEELKKQLNALGEKGTDAARGNLVKQIEQKQKTLDRSLQDARDEAQNQQSEIAQRILQKMAPVMLKYAADNGFGLVLDTSKPWPDGPVIWAGQTVDITRAVVDAYNAQSGVPAPPKPTAAAAPKAAPKATTPASTTPK
jgi:Skp family chaperone for outer membrane proteins